MANSDIRGQVLDEDGNPVQGATVYLFKQNNPNSIKTITTDSNGEYVFQNHPDGDGTETEWFVASFYEEADGDIFNTLSKPKVFSTLEPSIPSTVVENFEDNDISNYSGDVGSFQTTTSPVYNGSYALEETYGSNQNSTIADVNITISEDQLYQAAIRPVKDKVTSVLFMSQDATVDGSYEVGYYHNGDEFRTPVGAKTLDLSLPDWFIVEFEKLSDGTVNCRLLDTNQNELASTTGTDDSYTSGGLGFYVNNVNTTDGGNAAYDYVVTE